MSNSKDLTENTLPLSSAGNTAAKAQPSEQLVSSENTQDSISILKKQSETTLTTGKDEAAAVLQQSDNTQISERIHLHATLLKVALKILLKAGLTKRYRVLSEDRTTVLKIRYEFDLSQWTEEMELKP